MDHSQRSPDPLAGVRATPRRDTFAAALNDAKLSLRDVEHRARAAGRPVSKEVVRQMRTASDAGLPASFKLRTALNVAHVLGRPVDELFEGLDLARFRDA